MKSQILRESIVELEGHLSSLGQVQHGRRGRHIRAGRDAYTAATFDRAALSGCDCSCRRSKRVAQLHLAQAMDVERSPTVARYVDAAALQPDERSDVACRQSYIHVCFRKPGQTQPTHSQPDYYSHLLAD